MNHSPLILKGFVFAPVISRKTWLCCRPEGKHPSRTFFIQNHCTTWPGLESIMAKMSECSALPLHTAEVWLQMRLTYPRQLQIKVKAWHWQADGDSPKALRRPHKLHHGHCIWRSTIGVILLHPQTQSGVHPERKMVAREVRALWVKSRNKEYRLCYLNFWKVTGKPALLTVLQQSPKTELGSI